MSTPHSFIRWVFALVILVTSSTYGYFGVYRAQSVKLPVRESNVDLSRLGDDWQTVCVIGPYSYNETVKELTGIEIDIERRSRISLHDSIALLVTLDGNGRYRLFEVPRRPADFTRLRGTCWPNDTLFSVETDGHTYVRHP